MVKTEKLKIDNVAKIDYNQIHTYNLLSVFITKQTLLPKNPIIINQSVLDKMLNIRKIFNNRLKAVINTNNITITSMNGTTQDELRLEGISNSYKILQLEDDEINLITEVYKQMKTCKIEKIQLFGTKRLMMSFVCKSLTTYIIFRSRG